MTTPSLEEQLAAERAKVAALEQSLTSQQNEAANLRQVLEAQVREATLAYESLAAAGAEVRLHHEACACPEGAPGECVWCRFSAAVDGAPRPGATRARVVEALVHVAQERLGLLRWVARTFNVPPPETPEAFTAGLREAAEARCEAAHGPGGAP